MTKLIINADDFGYSKGVNLGIVEAHKSGVVSSTTLMINMPAVEHAIALAEDHKQLGLGIHLVLDLGFPVHTDVPSLVDKEGKFRSIEGLEKHAVPEDIRKEVTSQIEKFLSFGITPTHIDSHHHVHGHEKVFPIVKEVAETYGIPLRKVKSYSGGTYDYFGVEVVEYFDDRFYGESLEVKDLEQIILDGEKYETVEVMVHPAYVDEALLNGSSYNTPRVRELSILTDDRIQEFIKERNLELATYRDLSRV